MSNYNEEEGYVFVDIIARGLTVRYCRGAVHEVKQMFKSIFKCKIVIVLEMY